MGIGLTIENYYWNPLVKNFINSWRNRSYLIWCNNQQVDAVIDKLMDLLNLLLIAIIGRGEEQFHIIMEVCTDFQLIIQFVTPDIFRALRYGNPIGLLTL